MTWIPIHTLALDPYFAEQELTQDYIRDTLYDYQRNALLVRVQGDQVIAGHRIIECLRRHGYSEALVRMEDD